MQIKLIIGLGNPGREYANTYHNVGHLFVDYIREKNATTCDMVKTDTFMNTSGHFVAEALRNKNFGPEALAIAHDDSDIAMGEYKIDFDRNAGGHNGVQSVIDTLGTKAFWRIRIGIRPKEEMTRKKAEEFVLNTMSATDKKTLNEVFEKIVEELQQSLRA